MVVLQGRALRAQSLRLSHVDIRVQEPRVVFLSMKLVAECCESESRVGPVAQDNNNLDYGLVYCTCVTRGGLLWATTFCCVLVTNQRSLLPPAWQDWVPEGDRAWVILDAVAQRGSTTNELRVSIWFEHRFEQLARRCAHTVPRPTNFDLPMSDGRQSKK